jgi:hypothetical protein
MMFDAHTPDRQSQRLLLMLILVGTFLAGVGWYRWATFIF